MKFAKTLFRDTLIDYCNKFTEPLTLKQAAEVLRDLRKYDSEIDEYTEPALNEFYGWKDWEDMTIEILNEPQEKK